MRLTSLPALEDNYIWVLEDDAHALVVDPGDAAPVLAHFEARGRGPDAILVTHHHPDHCAGIRALLQRYPSAVVHAPDDPRITVAARHVAHGDRLDLGRWTASVIGVPGHTRSHVAYAIDGHLFCGDALFSLGCGRMNEGTPAVMLESLERMAALPDDTLVCCGHEYTLANAAFAIAVEPDNARLHARQAQARSQRGSGAPTLPSRLGDERDCNPFLRCAEPAVRAAAERWRGQRLLEDSDVFAALRAWKDGFKA